MRVEVTPESAEHIKILILQISIAVLVFLLAIGAGIYAVTHHRLLGEIREEQRKAAALSSTRFDEIRAETNRVKEMLTDIQAVLEAETVETGLIKEMLADIQVTLEVGQGSINRLREASRDREIMGMMREKLSYDYASQALHYFQEGNYENAFTTFSLALQYQRGNSTLQFYQTYSLYLWRRDSSLTPLELANIQIWIQEMKDKGFQEQDRLEYTEAEMQQKMTDMENDLEIQRRQAEHNE